MSNKKFINFLRILILILACIAASVVIVFPLWKFSTSAPKVYTIVVLSLSAAFIIYLIVRKIIRKNKNQEKNEK